MSKETRICTHPLQSFHACIIGVGGVGSWAGLALAAAGVGKLTLVDLDDVCITNINRQAQAGLTSVGMPKVEALRQQILHHYPHTQVHTIVDFFSDSSIESIFGQATSKAPAFDFVFDAIDRANTKILILETCLGRGIPILVSGGSAGFIDPTDVTIDDLSVASYDMLLTSLRNKLKRYEHAREGSLQRDTKGSWGIPCVFAPKLRERRPSHPNDTSVACAIGAGPVPLSSSICNDQLGTASFITSAFGALAAQYIADHFLKLSADQKPQR
jgi:tRNA A37 threonylcarbamoyladenosine dehydratase